MRGLPASTSEVSGTVPWGPVAGIVPRATTSAVGRSHSRQGVTALSIVRASGLSSPVSPPPNSGKQGSVGVSGGQPAMALTCLVLLVRTGAPGRIRTCAPGSGGRTLS